MRRRRARAGALRGDGRSVIYTETQFNDYNAHSPLTPTGPKCPSKRNALSPALPPAPQHTRKVQYTRTPTTFSTVR